MKVLLLYLCYCSGAMFAQLDLKRPMNLRNKFARMLDLPLLLLMEFIPGVPLPSPLLRIRI